MEYDKLEHFLSPPRMGRFLLAGKKSEERARQLYEANLKVAGSFYPILNLFEIFLRNAVYNRMSEHFKNPNWIIDEAAENKGFMSDLSLEKSKFFLRKSIKKTVQSLENKKIAVCTGKVIAEQSLGFWTSLFDSHHYKLIQGAVIHTFPYKPNCANRNHLREKLNPDHALELRHEGLNSNKSGSFIGFGIAPLW